MNAPSAKPFIACAREVGSGCPYCSSDIVLGEPIMVCQACGTVHHRACWRKTETCGSYSCIPARRTLDDVMDEDVLRISGDDLAGAVPLPVAPPMTFRARGGSPARPKAEPATNRLAIASLICGLAGIPFFVPGFLALLLGGLALSAIRGSSQKGAGLAITGISFGIVGCAGWLIVIVWAASSFDLHPTIEHAEFQPDVASIEGLDPPLRRAMLANVLIEHRSGLGGMGLSIGSGVILGIDKGEAVIVTNRHVVDDNFAPSTTSEADLKTLGPLEVRFFGKTKVRGRVVWTAPDGVDLALVRVPMTGAGDEHVALWRKGRAMAVGAQVFAIGNPHRLGWTHTQGVISQFRAQRAGDRQVRLIQVQVALNPGNSGGGLYDREGYLLGINSIGQDKRVSEGIGFAISLDNLLDLNPPDLSPFGSGRSDAPAPIPGGADAGAAQPSSVTGPRNSP